MQYRMNLALVALATAAVLIGTAGVAQAGLIAHWAFDEAVDASTAVDSTGNGHAGTIDIASAYKPTTGQPGKIGNSYFFVPAADPAGIGGVEVPHASDIDTFSNATFCGWLYVAHSGVHLYKPLFSKWGTVGESYNHRVYMENHTMQVRFRPPGVLQSGWNDDKVITDNAWHQVAITYTGPAYGGSSGTATATLYVDGVQIDQDSLTNQTGIVPTTDALWLGTFEKTGGSTASFDGWLDDLGIWGETLSDAKVKSLFNVVGVSGLEEYNLSYMETVFSVAGGGSAQTPDGLTWEYTATTPGTHALGDVWYEASEQTYYVKLGSGVKAVIPEPSTLLLLATGLLGLLAYAWRKRK